VIVTSFLAVLDVHDVAGSELVELLQDFLDGESPTLGDPFD
jgi:hypothetical protein